MHGALVLRVRVNLLVRAASIPSTFRGICGVHRSSAVRATMGVTAVDETNKSGAFERKESSFRSWIRNDASTEFPAEAGRYHLYVSAACPWASRALAVMYMKPFLHGDMASALQGLENVIGLSNTHPTWQRTRPDDPHDTHTGWFFADPKDPPVSSSTGMGSFAPIDCIPDTVNGAKFVRDLYEKAQPGYSGKSTVPVLWDKKTHTIVNNESSEILRMFNAEFNHLAKNPDLDLYPTDLREKIDAVNEWVYPSINNGVYRCGFAKSQAAYEAAYKELFEALDRAEGILAKQRYLAGDRLTEADVRALMTLIRFDDVYVVYFKTNRNFIHEMPNLANYVRDVYQTAGVAKAVLPYHFRTHYFTSHPALNTYAIIPVAGREWWKDPHDRNRFANPAK